MNYQSAMDYIHSTQKFGSRLGLENVGLLLSLLGNPQEKLRFVHVAGTNGKGSTSSFISTILQTAGYKTGLFTSPSLHSYNERIRMNSHNITNEDMAVHVGIVKEKIDEMVANGSSSPTEFEIMTAVAFSYYAAQHCDIVVLEVGLGGLLDATNIIASPLVAVITQIDFDHMEYLGTTLGEIAANKAGIIKEGCQVVLYGQEEEAEAVIKAKCLETGSSLTIVDFSSAKVKSTDLDGQVFDYEGYENIKIKLLGAHQIHNAIVALKCALALKKIGFAIPDEVLYDGFAKTIWAGRMEVLQKNPVVLIDGAHNLNGVTALAEALKGLFPEQKLIFIMGVLADKEYHKMIEQIAPLAKRFITIAPDTSRALPAETLAEILKPYCSDAVAAGSVSDAVALALKGASADDVICGFGSLYYLAEVRACFGLDEHS